MPKLIIKCWRVVPDGLSQYDVDVFYKETSRLGARGAKFGICHIIDRSNWIPWHTINAFVDIKIHDTPSVAAEIAKRLVYPRVRMITVHAAGGVSMIRAVKNSVCEEADKKSCKPPKVIAVTKLTSLPVSSCRFSDLVGNAIDAGIDGITCSAKEATTIKSDPKLNNLETVVPGWRSIRNISSNPDHLRVSYLEEMTDEELSCIDHLVIGRAWDDLLPILINRDIGA